MGSGSAQQGYPQMPIAGRQLDEEPGTQQTPEGLQQHEEEPRAERVQGVPLHQERKEFSREALC